MGFRFRKSIKILPGVRINLSKTGIGASVGVKGLRVTKRADGKIQTTASIPGTGISYVETHSPKERSIPIKDAFKQEFEAEIARQALASSANTDSHDSHEVFDQGQEQLHRDVVEDSPGSNVTFGVTQDGMFLNLDALNARALRSLLFAFVAWIALWLARYGSRYSDTSTVISTWLFMLPPYLFAIDSYTHAWLLKRCNDRRASVPRMWSFILLLAIPGTFFIIS